MSQFGALARFLFMTLWAWNSLPRAGRRVVLRIFINQVWFTAIQAIPLIAMLAGILSFLVISQAVRELGRLGATELIGILMVVAIVRELGPLLTALAIVGRSGTAIAAELATNRVMGEIDALEGMGIDPIHYLVLPRFLAAIVSVFGLLIVFDLAAVLAGLAGAVINGMTSARYLSLVLDTLTVSDVGITIAKGLLFGIVIGIVPSFHGLRSGTAATQVPISAAQAVVVSIVGIFVLSAVFVVVG